jgi:hypothetical protein
MELVSYGKIEERKIYLKLNLGCADNNSTGNQSKQLAVNRCPLLNPPTVSLI